MTPEAPDAGSGRELDPPDAILDADAEAEAPLDSLPDIAHDEDDEPLAILRGAGRTAVLLTLAGIGGQVFTLARELVVADREGVSAGLDALLVAAVAPTMMASLLSSGTAAAIVPAYLATREARGRASADRLFSAALWWTAILGVGLVGVCYAFAGTLIEVSGPGLDPASQAAAGAFMGPLAPMLVFSACGGLLAALFQIHDRMKGIAIAWLLGPVVSVVLTLGLWPVRGLDALAIAMTFQQATIVLVLLVLGVRYRILPRPAITADRIESVKLIRHAMPLTISSSVLQLNLLTDRAVATLVTPGAVSALRYAEGVIRIPMNAILPAWSAAIYPALVRASLLPDTQTFALAAGAALRYITVIFVPLAIATAAMAPVIVDVAYVRGAFDLRAADLTAAALAGFAPLLFLTMTNSVLNGAHNALRRGTFLMLTGFLNAFLNALFNVGFGLVLGVAGIALSTSVTAGIVQWLKAWRLGKVDPSFPLNATLLVSGQSLVASLLAAAPVALIAWNLPHRQGVLVGLVWLVVLSGIGLTLYAILSRLMGLKEVGVLLAELWRRPVQMLRGGR